MTETQKALPRRVIQAIFSSPWAISAEWAGLASDWSDTVAVEEYIRASLAQAEALRTITDIARREPSESIEAVQMRAGRPLANTHAVDFRDNGVAVIPVDGVIFRYADAFGMISGGVSTEMLARDFTSALDNPAVKAIVFAFDTPGGQLKGLMEFANAIYEARGKKPMASYVGGGATSAGYVLAAAAGDVVTDPTAPTGSLGVVSQVDVSKSSDDGKTLTIISSQSPNKWLDPASEAGRSELQARIDKLAQYMIDRVAAYRDTTSEALIKAGKSGGIHLGQDAVAAGLADRLGSLESLISELGRTPLASAQINRKQGARTMTKEREVVTETGAENQGDEEILALRKQVAELAQLAKTNGELAETERLERLTAEANARVDAWEKEGRLTGNATTEFRGVYVAISTGKAVTREQMDKVVAALPKIDTARLAADAKPVLAADAVAPTREDFLAAERNGSRTAKSKIDACVKAQLALPGNAKKQYAAVYKEIRAAAFAPATI